MERILLVEDDSAIYQPLTSFLRGEGFAVRQASGQREALALLETEEFDLVLLVFLNHRGATLSRAQLLEEIWDVAGDFVNDNTLTVYIKRLRDKLEDDPQDPALIRTVRGVGYRMEG